MSLFYLTIYLTTKEVNIKCQKLDMKSIANKINGYYDFY